MSGTTSIEEELTAFGQAYDYDVSYLLQLNDASPGAFAAFRAAQALSSFREELPLDAHFVTRITAMQGEDCGPCAQLNLRMAVEAGVDRELLATLLDSPAQLPSPLQDVRAHTQAVVTGAVQDHERTKRLRQQYGEAAFAEIGACVAGSRIYPTLKRALLGQSHCQKLTLEF